MKLQNKPSLRTYRFQSIEDIGDINCSDSIQNSLESTVFGTITSTGFVDNRLTCPKCYSTNVEHNDKTIRYMTCKSRSLYGEDSINQKEIELSIVNVEQNLFDLVVDVSKIRALLEECNHQELCEQDLIEHEGVLLALSSINISVKFNRKK